MAVDKSILKMHVDQAHLNGLAFWVGFANGFLNEVMPKKVKIAAVMSDDEKLYEAVSRVYSNIYGTGTEYTPQLALKLENELRLNGVDTAPGGVKYLWDGFVSAYQPDTAKAAEAAALDEDLRALVQDTRSEILQKLRQFGEVRVNGMLAGVIFRKMKARPGYWEASVFDAAATPQGEIVERSAEAMLDRFCGYTGSTKTGIAAQPSPVKEKVQAQWLRQDNYEDASYKVFCSNCFKLNGKNTLDECPNCGAKMVDVNPGLSKGG